MRWLAGIVLAVVLSSLGFADGKKPVPPSEEDKCPVCGMFTAKYPDFLAEIVFQDGSYVTFDGPRDLFKYYFDLERYGKGKEKSDIDSIYVTEYYRLVFIEARDAVFVVGSDVRGPMGAELIAFDHQEDAAIFKQDHKGEAILKFGDITSETLKSLR